MIKNSNNNYGFTIIEMSLTISILAIIASTGVAIFSQQSNKNKRQITFDKITVIEKSIQDYTDIEGYLPCPGIPSAAESDNQFGRKSEYNINNAECTSSGHATGMIPTRDLNIPDEYAFDGWGKKFSYRIAKGMGSTSHFNDNRYNGDIRIADLNGYEKTNINRQEPHNQGAAYVIISYGPKGKGAWGKNSNEPPILPNEASKEFENSNHFENKLYIQNSPTFMFDNLVSFKHKREIISLKQGLSPLKIPENICNDAEIIFNNDSSTLSDQPLANQITASASSLITLCKNPPLIDASSICQFSPSNIQGNNIFAWYDAAHPNEDSSLLPNNAFVNSLYDRSGNRRNAVSTSSQPIFKNSNTPFSNNLPAIYFNGVNNLFNINGNLNNINYTIFIIEAVEASFDTNHNIIGNKTTTPNAEKCLSIGYYLDNNQNYYQQLGHHNSNISINLAIPTSPIPNIIVAKLGPNRDSNLGKYLSFERSDGLSKTTFNSDNSRLNTNLELSIGGKICGNNYYKGFLGEIIIYNIALSESEIEEIKGYLLRKWVSGECPS